MVVAAADDESAQDAEAKGGGAGRDKRQPVSNMIKGMFPNDEVKMMEVVDVAGVASACCLLEWLRLLDG